MGDLSLFIFGYWVNRYEVIFGRMQKADRQRKLVLGEQKDLSYKKIYRGVSSKALKFWDVMIMYDHMIR